MPVAASNQATPTQRMPARRRPSMPTSGWWVHVICTPGPQIETGLPVPARGLVVGRTAPDAEASLPLADPAVSRRHVELIPGADGVRVVDLGSSNGIWVDARPVRDVVARDGAVVRLGETVLLLVRGDRVDEDDALGLYGRTPAMAQVRALLRRVAPSRLPVLIEGETGTGKELVAQALHAHSLRSGRLVPINCAALSPALVESTLFGHRRGAFTSATSDQDGAFQAAQRGTLLLDEIGDLPLDLQPKLLRALENGEVLPVGASQTLLLDVRLLAATLVPLEGAVARGRFRGDLLGRLLGVQVRLPPLRERRDDVMLLLGHFLPPPLRTVPATADFVEALLVHPWPRNVRELRQLAHRISVLHPAAPRLDVTMLEPAMAAPVTDRTDTAPLPAPDVVAAGPPAREELVQLLARHDGNVADVARSVGRSRKQVYRWMAAHGVPRGAGR